MPVSMIFPNLPVADVARATDFYLALGFTKNEMFSDENATSIVVSEHLSIMLLAEPFYQGFLPEGHSASLDASKHEVLLSLLLGSNDEVDAFTAATEQAGGTVFKAGFSDAPGMYGSRLADPDGHILEVFFMEMPEA